MTTPINDFAEKYAKSGNIRLHMPGHKGKCFIGCENGDITEISGADSLFEASGIIKESEENASSLFGCKTFYSTEGSSLCIRAMLYLYKLFAGKDAKIIASRNAHKAFISAVSLLDIDVEWLYPENGNYLSCDIDNDKLIDLLSKSTENTAVYITSPDYLGNVADIKAISEICKKYNAILLVDNAHGAYLKFLEESKHPIDLGAGMCCDSAHKTLPVITGGAYLHIANNMGFFAERAKDALSLFGSTSPSYLILRSLDKANEYIYGGYSEKLREFTKKIAEAVEKLIKIGYCVYNNEPLKITVCSKEYGYFGFEFAELLEKQGVIAEFADRDFAVLMLTPENGESDIEKLIEVMASIPKRNPICEDIPKIVSAEKALSPRNALFAESEIIDAKEAVGRIFAGFNVACPPAVPIIVCGEIIDENTIKCFKYYGIEKCRVITEEKT